MTQGTARQGWDQLAREWELAGQRLKEAATAITTSAPAREAFVHLDEAQRAWQKVIGRVERFLKVRRTESAARAPATSAGAKRRRKPAMRKAAAGKTAARKAVRKTVRKVKKASPARRRSKRR